MKCKLQKHGNRQYITAHIQDFTIFSSYKEELKEDANEMFAQNFMANYKNLGENVSVILPVGLSLLLIIAIYLIVSIGHTKGKEGIDLNDLDKIPYEILGFACLLILGIGIAMLEGAGSLAENMTLCRSLFLTSYIIVYVVCAVLFDTTVKRIKARTLLKNTLFYRCWKWLLKIVKKTIDKIKEIWNHFTESMDLVKKLALVLVGYVIVAIILLGIFNLFGLLLDFGLAVYIFYKIVERINCFTKIEKHLKAMYEGEHPAKLEAKEFTSEFQNTVTYINDISNGFENAIQEGIKSERLKTELITNVSHDIKTPLTSIINYVDLLKKENIKNKQAKEYIEVLDSKARKA